MSIDANVKQAWDDKAFVLKKVKRPGRHLQYASDRLRDNKEVVMAAIEYNCNTLEYASDRLKDDKDVIKAAVSQDSYAIQYASDRLKDDKELALMVVSNSSLALHFVSDRLKNDKDVVLAAVENKTGWTLEYAGETIMSDISFCIECASKSRSSVHYFKGAAAELFKENNNDVDKVNCFLKQQAEQQQANDMLLNKLKQTNNPVLVFKRKIVF